ncbi:MAG TPA: tetratricopeptide repeat protein, partial [Nannocystaceae bacterium]|nr:tetratricopeptide repeat protein [Nannocystaceae bacterium]
RAALCGGARAQLAGIWDDDRRASARTAVLGTELSFAPGVWERVEPALDRYADRWIATHEDACEATALRGEQSTALLDLRMNCLRKAKVELAATTTALLGADRRTVEKAHGLVSGLPRLEQCDDVDALQADVAPPRSDEERDRVRAIEATLATARTQLEIGSYEDAMATIDGAATEVEALDYGPIRTSWALAAGNAHEGLGDYEKAETIHVGALQSALQWRQWTLASRAARELTFEVGGLLHRHAEGLAYAHTALGLARGLGSAAEASAKGSLASIYNAQGKPAAAESELREALTLWDAAPVREEMGVASTRSNLAVTLAAQGKLEESEHELRTALEVYERELGPEHPSVASMRNNLAVVLRNRGNFAGAEAEQRRALEVYERAFGLDHPNIASSRSNLAVTLESQQRFAEAEAETRRAIAIYEKTLGADHVDVASARANLGSTLRSLGRLAEAEAALRESLAILQKKLPADHPTIAYAWHGLGWVLLDAQRFAEAAEAFTHARRIRDANAVAPTLRAETTVGLARATWPSDPAGARELRRAALSLFREAGEPGAEGLRELEAWIAEAP